MSLVAFLEGSVLTSTEWIEHLRIDHSDFNKIVEDRVLRLENSDKYRLSFVGVVVFRKSLLFAQPKFGDACSLSLQQILGILRTYFGRSPLRSASIDMMRDPEYGDSDVLREFDALSGLQAWFFIHGIYRREQAQASAHGRPHWVKTIAKRLPILIQDSVIYPSIIGERRTGVLNDISDLQIAILRYLLERYGLEVPSSLTYIEQPTEVAVSDWPLSKEQRTYFLRRLAIEQRGAFRTDALQLLKLLQGVLESKLAGPVPRPLIYGTTAFHAVWEDACRVAFNGDPDPASMLGQPVWWGRSQAGTMKRYETAQIPDIIVVQDSWRLIIDAKYYYRFPESHPGAQDIIKQFYYAESLHVAPEHVLSIFILPLPGADDPAFLGHATIEGAHRTFGNIEAWGLDPASLFAKYVSTSTSSKKSLVEPILAKRSFVAKLIGEAPTSIGSE